MKVFVSVCDGRLRCTCLSLSLSSIIREFLNSDEKAAASQISAEEAQAAYPKIVKSLGKALDACDYDFKILELIGYKKNLDPTMTDFFIGKRPSQITHAVVIVNHMAIDICRQRMGTRYPLPLTYPMRELSRYWSAINDRTHLLKMTPDEVAYRKELMKKGSLRLPGEVDDELKVGGTH